MKNVFLIVTTDKYPEGDAGAVRTHAFARIFRELGYTPLVVGMGAAEIYELARRFPAVSFRLAGAVSEEVALWEVPENLSLLGPLSHDDVLREMDEADLFLFPSHSEGFSVALMEAMARGLPAIATDVGANADMLNLTGSHIVSVGDVVAMSNALEHLNNAQVRAQISLASVKKVKENYVAKVVMENLKRYYASCDTIASP